MLTWTHVLCRYLMPFYPTPHSSAQSVLCMCNSQQRWYGSDMAYSLATRIILPWKKQWVYILYPLFSTTPRKWAMLTIKPCLPFSFTIKCVIPGLNKLIGTSLPLYLILSTIGGTLETTRLDYVIQLAENHVLNIDTNLADTLLGLYPWLGS